MSFRLKTILGIALIESALLLVLVLSTLSFLHSSNQEQLLQRSRTMTQLFAATAKDAVLATDLASLDDLVGEMLDQPDVKYARVRGDGSVLAEAGDPAVLARPFLGDADLRAVADGIFDVSAEILVGDQLFGRVELGLATRELRAVLERARRWTISIAVLEVVLVAIFSWVLGTWLTRQLKQLREASETIAEQGPGLQVPVQGRDEIATATRAFNRMSARLADSYHDLTAALDEARRLEQRAARNEAKNAATLLASLDAIVTVDVQGRIVEFNDNAARLFGYEPAEAIGAPMAEIVIPERMRAAHQRGMDRYLSTGQGRVLNRRLQLPARHRDGHEFPVEMNISPIQTENSLLFTSFMRDISGERTAERELRLAAQVLEADEGIFITDVKGCILRVNRAFTRITGYTAEEALGNNPRMLASGRHDRFFYAEMWRTIRKQGQWRGEIENRRKDGRIYPELLSITAVRDEQDATTHYVAHFFDISERKQTEERLRTARAQAEAANAAKSRFLATMSHEIRTPLNAIIGMNQLLLESGLSAEQASFARASVDGGQLLLALLNNVLDFSKIEAGRLTLEPEWFDPLATLESVVELFSNEASSKRIELALVFSPDVPPRCLGDRLRIQQVMTNLLGNAVKFTEQGGVVVRFDYLAPETGMDGCFRLQVCDSGIGLSEADQTRLFGEFVQADDGATRRYGGTGLGLAISQQLAQMMGGRITCESAPGAGSTFCFELPMTTGKEQASDELDAAIAALRTVRVVVYSPNPMLGRGLREQLEREAIPSEVLTEIETVRALAEHSTAGQQWLFLLDTPVQETELAAVRAFLHCNPHLPCVRLAPNAEIGAIESSKQAGFRAMVRKPARRWSLLRYMAIAIGGPVVDSAPAPRASALADTSSRAASILLVEDNPLNVEVTRAALQQSRHRVAVVGSGLDALTVVDQEDFDLILMDISMPGMDGLEATRRIRAGHSPNRATPIIAMTANAFAEDRERCAQAGMNDFLSKPIDIDKLRTLVTHWLVEPATMETAFPASEFDPTASGKRLASAESAISAGAGQLAPLKDFPILDEQILDQLAADTTVDLPRKLVEMFLSELKQREDELSARCAAGDLYALGEAAHRLKGSAGTLGAGRLQQIALVLEKAAKGRDETQAKRALVELEPTIKETQNLLKSWLDSARA